MWPEHFNWLLDQVKDKLETKLEDSIRSQVAPTDDTLVSIQENSL